MKNIFSSIKKELTTQAGATAFIPSTKTLRAAVLGFITQSLRPYVDERSLSVAGIHFYAVCSNPQQEEALRAALCMDKPGMFKKEHLERTLANHFIQLDPAWFFEWHVVKDQLPADCLQQENFGLKVVGAGEPIGEHYCIARIQVLAGQTAEQEYLLDPEKKQKFYIGRTSNPQLQTGKIQQNDIVFLGREEAGFNALTGMPNLHVSRNHAYIVYETKTGRFLLYPDRGGLPENGNKLKVHTCDDKVKWLNIYGVAHWLQEGDQVELGGEAVLRFHLVTA